MGYEISDVFTARNLVEVSELSRRSKCLLGLVIMSSDRPKWSEADLQINVDGALFFNFRYIFALDKNACKCIDY